MESSPAVGRRGEKRRSKTRRGCCRLERSAAASLVHTERNKQRDSELLLLLLELKDAQLTHHVTTEDNLPSEALTDTNSEQRGRDGFNRGGDVSVAISVHIVTLLLSSSAAAVVVVI